MSRGGARPRLGLSKTKCSTMLDGSTLIGGEAQPLEAAEEGREECRWMTLHRSGSRFGSHLGSGPAACTSTHWVRVVGSSPHRCQGTASDQVRPTAPQPREEERKREGQHLSDPPMTAPGTSTARIVDAQPLEAADEGRKRAIRWPSSAVGAGLALASVQARRLAHCLARTGPRAVALIGAGAVSDGVWPAEGGRSCHCSSRDGDG